MATYRVTTRVTCDDEAELQAFVAHCNKHGVYRDEPGDFEAMTVDDADLTVTLVREQFNINKNEWS